MTRLIVDADVMVGAALGRSMPLFLDLLERGVEVLAPVSMLREAKARTGRGAHLIEGGADRRLAELLDVVIPLPIEEVGGQEQAARPAGASQSDGLAAAGGCPGARRRHLDSGPGLVRHRRCVMGDPQHPVCSGRRPVLFPDGRVHKPYGGVYPDVGECLAAGMKMRKQNG